MKYQFRKSQFSGSVTVESTHWSVKLVNSQGRTLREIPYTDVKEIDEFTGISALDERGQRFTIHLCRVVPKFGRSINFQSSSFLEFGGKRQVARNQFSDFERLKQVIREEALDANPDVKIVLGERLTCRIGYGMIAVGMAIVALITYADSQQAEAAPVATAIGAGVFFSPIFLLGLWVVRKFQPVRVPIRETLPGGPVTENTKLYRDSTQS